MHGKFTADDESVKEGHKEMITLHLDSMATLIVAAHGFPPAPLVKDWKFCHGKIPDGAYRLNPLGEWVSVLPGQGDAYGFYGLYAIPKEAEPLVVLADAFLYMDDEGYPFVYVPVFHRLKGKWSLPRTYPSSRFAIPAQAQAHPEGTWIKVAVDAVAKVE